MKDGLDHPRSLVHEHCKQLLLNLLIVLSRHNDHLSVARILLNNATQQLGYGITIQSNTAIPLPNFIDPPNSKNLNSNSNGSSCQSTLGRNKNRPKRCQNQSMSIAIKRCQSKQN
jgi:hypothetical protein